MTIRVGIKNEYEQLYRLFQFDSSGYAYCDDLRLCWYDENKQDFVASIYLISYFDEVSCLKSGVCAGNKRSCEEVTLS